MAGHSVEVVQVVASKRMQIFGTKTIRARVLEVIEQRIAVAQGEYDDGCVQIDDEAKGKKERLAERLVEGIIGKVI